jgi:hypothetical protein
MTTPKNFTPVGGWPPLYKKAARTGRSIHQLLADEARRRFGSTARVRK